MQSHLLPVSVPWGKLTRAHWAAEPDGLTVVFVHGFNGASVDTWSEFDRFLTSAGRHDVVFYGYDSLRLRATVAALELAEFLRALFSDSARTVNSTLEPELHRGLSFETRKVVLVAHSLGAVVCRQALLAAHNAKERWVSHVCLVLFAPAHMGAHLLSLATGLLGAFRLPLAPVAKWRFPVLAELEEGSNFLKALREETQKAMETEASAYLRARALAICKYDEVVNQQPFCPHDATAVVLSRDHRSICKPDEHYSTPMEIVTKAMRHDRE